MLLDFEKWHAASNDFIVVFAKENIKNHQMSGQSVDKKQNDSDFLSQIIRRCPEMSRRFGCGIGADGILVIVKPPDDYHHEKNYSNEQKSGAKSLQTFGLYIINQDGSMSQNCGNGLRVATLACFYKYSVETDEKYKFCEMRFLVSDDKSHVFFRDKNLKAFNSNQNHLYSYEAKVHFGFNNLNNTNDQQLKNRLYSLDSYGITQVDMKIADSAESVKFFAHKEDIACHVKKIQNMIAAKSHGLSDLKDAKALEFYKFCVVGLNNNHLVFHVTDKDFNIELLSVLAKAIIKCLADDFYNIHFVVRDYGYSAKLANNKYLNKIITKQQNDSSININNIDNTESIYNKVFTKVLSFERGVGITKACGSGSIASIVSTFDLCKFYGNYDKADQVIYKDYFENFSSLDTHSNLWHAVQLQECVIYVKVYKGADKGKKDDDKNKKSTTASPAIYASLFGTANFCYKGRLNLSYDPKHDEKS